MGRCTLCGKFSVKDGTYQDDHGYLRISAGPLRGVRVHTLVMEAKLGRKLAKDEQVDHYPDPDKLNCSPDNLRVLGIREHGAVSAKQAWYFKEHEIKSEKEWQEWFATSPEVPPVEVELTPFENQF